jgi:HD-GYP domain-containing protein (c-di-GMP phosphodiesterase class II)
MTAVLDTYHALVSDRPYRQGMKPEKALSIIQEVRGTQLCPECVDLFIDFLTYQKKDQSIQAFLQSFPPLPAIENRPNN